MWPWLNKKRIEKELKQKWKRIENVLKKMSKKKQRRQKKRDRKQKDLEESAARMGCLDDLEQVRAAREEAATLNLEDTMDEHEFAKTLENDPELAEELRAVERELAQAYPEENQVPTATSDSTNDERTDQPPWLQ